MRERGGGGGINASRGLSLLQGLLEMEGTNRPRVPQESLAHEKTPTDLGTP